MKELEQETLEYRLQKLEEQSSQILKSIDALRDSLPEKYVTKEMCHAQMSDLGRRVMELERSKNTAFWAILTGGGSLVITLLRFVLGL